MYIYQKNPRFFAQYAPGMEELTKHEIATLGGYDIQEGYLGWYFHADSATLYRINYCSRFLIRILAPLWHFPCDNPDLIYQNARKIEWRDFINVKQTFAIFSTVANSNITHSKYAALRLKDAIVDHFKDVCQDRPSIDTENPNVWFGLHIENNRATIHLDTSGGSLHRRGYRKIMVSAPMQETLAAAIVSLSGWNGERPLYDPMCGSGTLLFEAQMHYCRIPAGYLRSKFGFEYMPDFQPQIWKEVKQRCNEAIRPLPHNLISGSDNDSKAIQICRTNGQKLPYSEAIKLDVCDFEKISQLSNYTILCNPPYGIRLTTEENLAGFYKQFGDFLKKRCQNSTAYIYFGDRQWLKSIGLHPKFKKPLSNGGLDGRLAKFELY